MIFASLPDNSVLDFRSVKTYCIEIHSSGQDLLSAHVQLGLEPHGQGKQIEQWIKILLPAQRFQADPVNLTQIQLKLSR